MDIKTLIEIFLGILSLIGIAAGAYYGIKYTNVKANQEASNTTIDLQDKTIGAYKEDNTVLTKKVSESINENSLLRKDLAHFNDTKTKEIDNLKELVTSKAAVDQMRKDQTEEHNRMTDTLDKLVEGQTVGNEYLRKMSTKDKK